MLQLLDKLVSEGAITDTIIAQIGHSDYEPKYYPYQRFIQKDRFDRYIEEADAVLTHGGVGSIVTALKRQKPVIVYPRLAKYQEHVDDHQLEIAHAFAKKGYVLCCDDDRLLPSLIESGKGMTFTPYVSQTENIVRIISTYLEEIKI